MTPPVRVVLPGVLREYAGGASELEVSLPSSQEQPNAPMQQGGQRDQTAQVTLRMVLDEALGSMPRLAARVRDETGALRRHVNVFVDGQDCRADGGLDRVVGEAAVVHIIPAVSGG